MSRPDGVNTISNQYRQTDRQYRFTNWHSTHTHARTHTNNTDTHTNTQLQRYLNTYTERERGGERYFETLKWKRSLKEADKSISRDHIYTFTQHSDLGT